MCDDTDERIIIPLHIENRQKFDQFRSIYTDLLSSRTNTDMNSKGTQDGNYLTWIWCWTTVMTLMTGLSYHFVSKIDKISINFDQSTLTSCHLAQTLSTMMSMLEMVIISHGFDVGQQWRLWWQDYHTNWCTIDVNKGK